MSVGISAQEYDDSADTKDASITVRVSSLELLESGRDVGEAREENVHNRDWEWLAWQRITVVVCCHCGKCCAWAAEQKDRWKYEVFLVLVMWMRE